MNKIGIKIFVLLMITIMGARSFAEISARNVQFSLCNIFGAKTVILDIILWIQRVFIPLD